MAGSSTSAEYGSMDGYLASLSTLDKPEIKIEHKLKAIQDLCSHLESIVAHPCYSSFLARSVASILRFLKAGEPCFISEEPMQQLRKLLLEFLNRIPSKDDLLPYVQTILSQLFEQFTVENEENGLIILKIVVEFHKAFKLSFNTPVLEYVQLLKKIYADFPNHVDKVFQTQKGLKVRDFSTNSLEEILRVTYSSTRIECEGQANEAEKVKQYTLIPRSLRSLRVLTEIPIVVVVLYKVCEEKLYKEIEEFIPIIMELINLESNKEAMKEPSFNKDIHFDFIAVQVKALMFLSYLIRTYEESVSNKSSNLVKGVVGLLKDSPQEAALLRGELLQALRHILGSKLRENFIPYVDQFMDDDLVIGTGWTASMSLRPLAFTILAEFVFHIREQMPAKTLTMAVYTFSAKIEDESLEPMVHVLSCKLLQNLVECILKISDENFNRDNELLILLLEVFTNKIKAFTEIQLPAIMLKTHEKLKQSNPENAQAVCDSYSELNGSEFSFEVTSSRRIKHNIPLNFEQDLEQEIEMSAFNIPVAEDSYPSISDFKNLVKALIEAAKITAWGFITPKKKRSVSRNDVKETNASLSKLDVKEANACIKFLKYALQALDIFAIPSRNATETSSKEEEKDAIGELAEIFTMFHPITFEGIFSKVLEYMINCIVRNPSIMILVKYFLANDSVSSVFALLLMDFLVKDVEEIGENSKRSEIYLQILDDIFKTIAMFPSDYEKTLQIFLRSIVTNSLKCILRALEPGNYLKLLNSLFTSVGNGDFSILSEELVPILPYMLRDFNSWQTVPKNEKFVYQVLELCLSIPVPFKALIPYVSLIMRPIVSALSGPQNLILQAMQTLEAFVDNLEADYLYECILPVKDELMQGIYNALRSSANDINQIAFRILGKIGKENRTYLMKPQKVEHETNGPSIAIFFDDYDGFVSLPVKKITVTAFNTLLCGDTQSFYIEQCWEIIKGVLAASIKIDKSDNKYHFFTHASFHSDCGRQEICSNEEFRETHKIALMAMFVAASIDINEDVVSFMEDILVHYTLVAIAQHRAAFSAHKQEIECMDPAVLIDAAAAVTCYHDERLLSTVLHALEVIIETSESILGIEKTWCLPFFHYMSTTFCLLCYEQAWYPKLSSCKAIELFFKKGSWKWKYENLLYYMKTLLFIIADLSSQISGLTISTARIILETILAASYQPNEELIHIRNKALFDIEEELIKQMMSANECVRFQVFQSLKIISAVAQKSLEDIVKPHRRCLANQFPPTENFGNLPINYLTGLLEGFSFCMNVDPSLLNIDMHNPDHERFFRSLISFCSSGYSLQSLPYYKPYNSYVKQYAAALQALNAFFNIQIEYQETIFRILFEALKSDLPDVCTAAYECMEKIAENECCNILSMVLDCVSTLLQADEGQTLKISHINVLGCLLKLFRKHFSEDLHLWLYKTFKKWLRSLSSTFKESNTIESLNMLKMCSDMLTVFHFVSDNSALIVRHIIEEVLEAEKSLEVEARSPLRKPLVEFLQHYPIETLNYLKSTNSIKFQDVMYLLKCLLKEEYGAPFCKAVEDNSEILIHLLEDACNCKPYESISENILMVPSSLPKEHYIAILIISRIIRYNDNWLPNQHRLKELLLRIWYCEKFHQRYSRSKVINFKDLKEHKMLAKCVLNIVKYNPDDIDLLFHMLRVFTGHFPSEFHFLNDFLKNTVADSYSVEWKRRAFFKFVAMFPNIQPELKAKVFQFIIIPSFSVAFQRGEGEKLICSSSTSKQDNIVTVFIEKIIDSESSAKSSDEVRILLLQFSSLLTEHVPSHIHDGTNKHQSGFLMKLMKFAWPCLLPKSCVDPAAKYHGHLLLAIIIAKFSIHRKIVLQVFHSLLKAHATEVRGIVRQALKILTPKIPERMDDGNNMLMHWTKKIIVEEGHSISQLVHILNLLVDHYKVYYPVRHQMIHYIITSADQLAFRGNVNLEHKQLAVDLTEIIIRWEIMRLQEQQKLPSGINPIEMSEIFERKSKLSLLNFREGLLPIEHHIERLFETSRINVQPDLPENRRSNSMPDSHKLLCIDSKAVERNDAYAVVNFLFKLACLVDESNIDGSEEEILAKRCVSLLKAVLAHEIWPFPGLNLGSWFENLLLDVKTTAMYKGICTGLDLLTFLLSTLSAEIILPILSPLQKGIVALLFCTNRKVLKSLQDFLSGVMKLFPSKTLCPASKIDCSELKLLYSSLNKFIKDGFSDKKSIKNLPALLNSRLLILKAVCDFFPSYIDSFLSTFVNVLQKMTEERLDSSGASSTNSVDGDLLIISLNLVKSKVCYMNEVSKHCFLDTILPTLIQHDHEKKILSAIISIIEIWVKNTIDFDDYEVPSLQESSDLLQKIMQRIEYQFPDDFDLNLQFFELVAYIYSEEILQETFIIAYLEPAFMAGLRCTHPYIRKIFCALIDENVYPQLRERLIYILTNVNWENMGPHFWIKQCIEMVVVAAQETYIQSATHKYLLPSVTSIIEFSNAKEKESHLEEKVMHLKMKKLNLLGERDEARNSFPIKEELICSPLSYHEDQMSEEERLSEKRSTDELSKNVQSVLTKNNSFQLLLRSIKTSNFLSAVVDLCHLDTPLAEYVWLQLFPKIWSVLNVEEQKEIGSQLQLFLCNNRFLDYDIHPPRPLEVFADAALRCSPVSSFSLDLYKYAGKCLNRWERSCLVLEDTCFQNEDFITENTSAYLEALTEAYSSMEEEDLYCGMWQKFGTYPETILGVTLEQQGFFSKAMHYFRQAMSKYKIATLFSPALILQSEVNMWNTHWIRCAQELDKWEYLLRYSFATNVNDHLVALQFGWRSSGWDDIANALDLVRQNYSEDSLWKISLYDCYISTCNLQGRHFNQASKNIMDASSLCIERWKSLPIPFSGRHYLLLQAAQKIREFDKAKDFQADVEMNDISEHSIFSLISKIQSYWCSEHPLINEDFSFWSDFISFRRKQFENFCSRNESDSTLKLLNCVRDYFHNQSFIQLAKISRKHGQIGMCLEYLDKIKSSAVVMDSFQKLQQHLKCVLCYAETLENQDTAKMIQVLSHAFNLICQTDKSYFTEEMCAKIHTFEGVILSTLDCGVPNANFENSVIKHVNSFKTWFSWGEFLEKCFTSKRFGIQEGEAAVTYLLKSCQYANQIQSLKPISKVLWLLSYDQNSRLAASVMKYGKDIPPLHWIPWLPQLFSALSSHERPYISEIIEYVGWTYPQSVYFPLQSLITSLELDAKSIESAGSPCDVFPQALHLQLNICIQLFELLKRKHFKVFSTLRQISDQIEQLGEDALDEMLKKLKHILASCYSRAFDSIKDESTTEDLNKVGHLLNELLSELKRSKASETLNGFNFHHIQQVIRDPVVERLQSQFIAEFNHSNPRYMKLSKAISKLKEWIEKFETANSLRKRSFDLVEKCEYLSLYHIIDEEVEIFGECFPKDKAHSVQIFRFMPLVNIVDKYNTYAKQLCVEGDDGKVYTYLIIGNNSHSNTEKSEKVLQLFQFLNLFLSKEHGTAKRSLKFFIPRTVTFKPYLTVVSDDESSLSLFDIYKQNCIEMSREFDASVTSYFEMVCSKPINPYKDTEEMLNIFQSVQENLVPVNLLKEWIQNTYSGASDYFVFRKQFVLYFSLAAFAEYAFHLTLQSPDMMYIHKDTGVISNISFKFESLEDNVHTVRPVPFRLTPNISHFVTPLGIRGVMIAVLLATANCFKKHRKSIQELFQVILKYEVINSEKHLHYMESRVNDEERINDMVTRVVCEALQRIDDLSKCESVRPKACKLVKCAKDYDNLCIMDPLWYPWL